MRSVVLLYFLLSFAPQMFGQQAPSAFIDDTDHDGLSDAFEQTLLMQFQPQFMISRGDCGTKPAEFVPSEPKPTVQSANGTIYGQAFPRQESSDEVELHYYHLWPRDCGEMGHHLDTEHVSVLLKRGEDSTDWKATYWYAAAHEDTVCDAGQLSRAASLNAEDTGAKIWVSAGKHASFLSEHLCEHGCGGDRCREMEPLQITKLINLGELHAPLNGALWTTSQRWPLAEKLARTDFPDARTALLERSSADIVWANPNKRPVQAALLGGNATLGGAALGARQTGSALAHADTSTDTALNAASRRAAGSLSKSYRKALDSLRRSATATSEALSTRSGD
jgi:hypothetical protein